MKRIKLYENANEKKAFLNFLKNTEFEEEFEFDDLVIVDPETAEELETLLDNYMNAYAEGLSIYLFPVKYWTFLKALEKNFDEGYFKRTYQPAEMLAKEKEIIRDCIGTIFGSEKHIDPLESAINKHVGWNPRR